MFSNCTSTSKFYIYIYIPTSTNLLQTSAEISENELAHIDSLSVEELIGKRLFSLAAEKVQDELIRTDGSDHQQIFGLWDTRIKCLLQLRQTTIIKEEARLFGDLGSERYRVENALSIVPWNFRLMMVNIQTGGEPALSRYYALAREARTEEANAQDDSIYNELRASPEVWRDRLRQLALHVGATLMNIGDYSTAVDHLSSLFQTLIKGTDEDKKFAEKAALGLGIVYLKLGDTTNAREYFNKADSKLFTAICSCADADWSDALSLLDYSNNLAIAKVNQGEFKEAIAILEKVVEDTPTNVVLNNIFTLYDLMHDVGGKSKAAVIESIRAANGGSLGTFDFLRKEK